MAEEKDVYTKGIQKVSVWVGFAITLSGLFGTYAVNNYKIGENVKKLDDMEVRLRMVERNNPDQLISDLKNIQQLNQQLDQKITSTNQRIDEILKALLNGKR